MTILKTVLDLFTAKSTVSSKVKSRMAARVRDLEYDWSQFTLPHFLEWLGTLEKRTFVCVPFEMPPELFGAWFSTTNRTEFIFYESQTSAVHQAHIVLHELGHYLLDHHHVTLQSSDLDAIRNDATGTVGYAILRRYLRCRGAIDRSPEEKSAELEAETFCSLIQEQIVRHARLSELAMWQNEGLTAGTYTKALELL